MPKIAAIIAAGGSSVRYGRNKLLEVIDTKTVLGSALEALARHDSIVHFFVATNDLAVQQPLRDLPSEIANNLTVCPGGSTRTHSVWSALKMIPETWEWIAVHDAARPFPNLEMIDRTVQAALKFGAAVPALPVHLTIKQATGPLPAPVERTVPREQLWAMQTPQIMRHRDLLLAFENCPIPLDQVTDDVQLLELIGLPVYLVPGDERNLKITTPTDLKLARVLLQD